MFATKYEEHLAHSAPCSSRWDGFDRGDDCQEKDQGSRVIGRMTSGGGYRVEITELWDGDWSGYEVHVDGKRVLFSSYKDEAITVARWWMAGCPV